MIMWGVEVGEDLFDQGSVIRSIDMTGAFLVEERYRSRGWSGAQAVVSRDDGVTWVRVPWGSSCRRDPRPPAGPRRLVWWDRLGRGGNWLGWVAAAVGRKPVWFGRRAL